MNALIGLTYDLRSEYLAMGFSPEAVAEFDSDATINALEQTIRTLGCRTDRIGHVKNLCARLVKGDRWDAVFNIAEGVAGRGRESQVPCLLDAYGIAYTFSDPLVCAVTLDKSVAKRLVQSAGLHTPRFHVARDPAHLNNISLEFPLFVKPLAEGTGKGIDHTSRVEQPEDLVPACRALIDRFRQPVLIEEYLPGREFTVGLVGEGPSARVLGVMEVEILEHAQTDIYSYHVKEHCEQLVRYVRPHRDELIGAVERLALESYRVLECRDAGRVDIRLDRHGLPAFMEVNPLPGLHPDHSDLPLIAAQEGVTYSDLIRTILEGALSRVR